MFRKTFFIFIPLSIFFLGGLFFFYRHSRVSREVSDTETTTRTSGQNNKFSWLVPRGSRAHLHPLADAEKLAAAKQQPVATWDEWIDATVEVILAEAILYGQVKTPYLTVTWWGEDTPVEIAERRQGIRESLTQYKKYLQEWRRPHPEHPGGLQSITELSLYWGPQPPTAESLLAEFDAVYRDKHPKAAYLDEHYPREPWLETLLEKGAHFNEYGDYKYYLGLRKSLLQKKEQPDEWHSGAHGIPITTDFNEYADGFMDRKVWEYSIVQKVSAENPGKSPSVYFDAEDPDKYFPVVGKMTYVNLGPDRQRMSTWGTLLTTEQKNSLWKNGIEPEGIEIVYVDDDNNVISEPPPLFDERQYSRENVISFDGIPITPENYEELLGHPMPAKWMENYEERQTRDTPPILPDTDAIGTAAKDAALQTQEQFQQGLRELEKFANMSDTEIQAELERRLTPQLPELPTDTDIENRLWSEMQSAQMTPARFEAALKILEKYGPAEGMQKLTEADPKAAEQVKRIFGLPPETEHPPAQQPAPEPQHRHVPPEPNR